MIKIELYFILINMKIRVVSGYKFYIWEFDHLSNIDKKISN